MVSSLNRASAAGRLVIRLRGELSEVTLRPREAPPPEGPGANRSPPGDFEHEGLPFPVGEQEP